MKKIKFVFLILGCLLFCGCAPYSYSIDFNQGVVNETIIVNFDYDLYEAADELAESDGQYSEYELVYGQIPALKDYSKYYTKNITSKDKGHIVSLNYKYTYDTFEDNMFINNCFENAIYLNEKDYYYVKLSGNFSCFADTSFNINLTTHNKIISSNATSIIDNKLIWNMDIAKSSYDVEFQISKNIPYEDLNKSLSAWQIIEIIVFVMIITVFISVGIIYFKQKKNH